MIKLIIYIFHLNSKRILYSKTKFYDTIVNNFG